MQNKVQRSDQQLNPLTAAAGFSYGELLLDRAQIGQQLKAALGTFPDAVKQETRRVVQARRQRYLGDLVTFAARADWLMFYSVMLDALRTTLQALFAVNHVYYPGDKWLRQSIRRFGLNTEILTLFDRLWEPVESAHERIAALRRLMDLVD